MTVTKAKVIFLGDIGVGKTSIVMMQDRRIFDGEYVTTIGANFITSSVQIANEFVKFQIWDTAGQELFRSMVPLYLRNAKAAFLVYDITRRETFQHIPEWVEDIHRWVADPIEIVILANKSDLKTALEVTTEEGLAMAQKLGCKFFETSAKNDSNIDRSFIFVAEQLLLKEKKPKPVRLESIQPMEETKKRRKCCGN